MVEALYKFHFRNVSLLLDSIQSRGPPTAPMPCMYHCDRWSIAYYDGRFHTAGTLLQGGRRWGRRALVLPVL
jgi:hypothetical protein